MTSTSRLTDADAALLDDAAWHSLAGPHTRFAIGDHLVRRYPADVAAFVGVRDWGDPGVWDSLAHVVGSGETFGITAAQPALPPGWEYEWNGEGVQLVETDRLHPRPDEEAVELGADDAAEMLALVERNQPGPFFARTYELGRYVGIRRGGRLIAMAGERLHPAGWTEISAVATDEQHRRQGLASRLVLDVAHAIRQRGDRAFLHAAAANTGAIAAYEKLGFGLRRRTTFSAVRVP
ncbi:MAG: GNAT family N-acetyltransferase [Microbacterium sp.]